MSWVKRNLYFLIGSVAAVALLGLAGFYFYSNWQLNNETLDKLNAAYEELDKLAKASPNPGNQQINNIEIAGQQEKEVLALIATEREYFSPIAPIPNPTNNVVTKEEFASALRRSLDELTHQADVASVMLPKNYAFSFEAERTLTIFAPGSLPPLSVQLGEISEICNVLYRAKVNSLDNLRRARVSADDQKGPMSDYLETGSISNQMAVLTPYEIVFHCFSTELAGVLDGFANNPHGFVVKALNVEQGASSGAADVAGGSPAPVASPSTRGSLPVLVEEKQLKVTLVLDLVKLLPKK
jgi:hypothetical protein